MLAHPTAQGATEGIPEGMNICKLLKDQESGETMKDDVDLHELLEIFGCADKGDRGMDVSK